MRRKATEQDDPTRVIAEVALAVAEELDPKRAARAVVEQARRALGADGVLVWEVVENEDRLRLLAHRGIPAAVVPRIRSLAFDAPTLSSRAAYSHKMQVQADMLVAAPELTITRELAQAYGFRSMVAAPLIARQQLVGVMTYGTKTLHEFSPGQLQAVMAIARIFAIGLANAKAYAEERELRAELEAIVDSSPEGILLIEAPTGRTLLANEAAARIAGRPIERAVSIREYGTVYGLRRANGAEMAVEEMPPSRAFRGHTVLGQQMLVHQPSGHEVAVLVSAAPVTDARGNVVAAVVLFQDITRVKELERQREEMVSIIAHDLRAPIAVIIGYAELMLGRAEKYGLAESPRQAMRGIRDSARTVDRLVADLLDVSRLESGKLNLRRQWVNLPALARNLVARLSPMLREHPTTVAVLGEAKDVWADPTRTERVLTNLLVNASKYSPEGTEIEVAIQPRDGGTEVSVADHGTGISAHDVERIFERHYRAPAQAGGRPGLGLGLYIAKSLVEAQGGRIWVESEPSRGSTFHFTLPAEAARTPVRSGRGS